MITDYQKFMLPDANKQHDLVADVNWQPEDPSTNNSQVIRITLPSGEKLYLKREHLNQILFAIGTLDDQTKLIPQTIQTVHWRETVVSVKATKDIHKGEDITFPIKLSVPCTNIQNVIGLKGKKFEKEVKQQQAKADKFTIK